MINKVNEVIILGAGTAGLVCAIMLREKYPYKKITIIKSGEIGIVGVGEGSTEHWAEFCEYAGIDVHELLVETKATVKIGILFKDWNSKGHEYVHSIFEGNKIVSSLNRLDAYNNLLLNNSKFACSGLFGELYYKNNVPLDDRLNVSNQFHFDTFKLNEYLTRKCIDRNVNIIDDIITSVDIGDNGHIQKIHSSNHEYTADLFIDCSGLKRVLATKQNNNWVSYSKYLPMNRAIAFPTEFDTHHNIEPYTTATALSAGWAWKIPTQDRYGNGYVFHSDYISTDEALHEISTALGKDVEKIARDIKFDAGRVEKYWLKNCICIGLSSSFAEPLEAQSIGFTILQCFGILDNLDQWESNNEYIENKYNKEFITSFENIVSYLQIHYFNKRNDSNFWRDKPFNLTDFNLNTKDMFANSDISPSLFNEPWLLFRAAHWYQIYYGLDLINRDGVIDRFNDRLETYRINLHARSCDISRPHTGSVISHREFLNKIISKVNIEKNQTIL